MRVYLTVYLMSNLFSWWPLWSCLFHSQSFCGYARPPGWTDNKTVEADERSNHPGISL